MKNLIFFFLLLSYAATGQENETLNKYILGGSIIVSNFTQISPEQEINLTFSNGATSTVMRRRTSTTTYDVGLRPYWGFQPNHRTLLGLEAQIDFGGITERGDDRDDIESKTRSFTYGAGIFYRFLINPKNKFSVFLQPFIRGNIENNREGLNSSEVDQRIIEFQTGIGLGATYQISKKWNLLINIWDVSYQYNQFRPTRRMEETTTRSFLSTGFSLRNISFGAEYLF